MVLVVIVMLRVRKTNMSVTPDSKAQLEPHISCKAFPDLLLRVALISRRGLWQGLSMAGGY